MINQIINHDLKEITENTIVPWQELAGNTILVTGGNGMIGSYLVETILFLNKHVFTNKAKVVCLTRSKEKTLNRFKHYAERAELEFIFQDICEPINYDGSIDYIIHAAAQTTITNYADDPVGIINSNVIGTNVVLQFAKLKSVKSVLFLSSWAVYGNVANKDKSISENDYGYLDHLNNKACYHESKRLAETMCAAYAKQYNLSINIARLFTIYAPSIQLTQRGVTYIDFINNIINNQDIVLKSKGEAIRSFCYITDAIIAFFLLLLKGKPAEAYNVGNSTQKTSILELAQMLVEMYPQKQLKIVMNSQNSLNIESKYISANLDKSVPNTEKLQGLGWAPKVSIEEGFKRVINALSQ